MSHSSRWACRPITQNKLNFWVNLLLIPIVSLLLLLSAPQLG